MMMRTKNRGFSLIELMIAILLGLILSAGIVQVFLANRQSQRFEQTLARMQENGRIAVDLITEDVRMAGHFGCVTPPKDGITNLTAPNLTVKFNSPSVSTDPVAFIAQSMQGFSKTGANTWSPALVNGLGATDLANARPGSDAIAIYYGRDSGVRLHSAATGSAALVVDLNLGDCPGKNKIVMISDCQQADVFRVTNVPNCASSPVTLQHDTTLNIDGDLGPGGKHKYAVTDAGVAISDASKPRLLEFFQNIYYVKDTGRKRSDTSAIYSLYRNGEEIIEGVEHMKVEFGEALGTGNIRYVSPDDPSIVMANVISVRIGVLVQSYDTLRDTDDTNTYVVANQSIGTSTSGATHPADRTLRQAYTTTIQLRNRMQ